LLAGLLASILAGKVIDPIVERNEAARMERPAPKRLVNRNDKEAVLRAAILSSSRVAFLYQGADPDPVQQCVYPRWLQVTTVAGQRTLCLMASEGVTGNQRAFALSRMSALIEVGKKA